jgi:glycine cleavage system transcriptional repressor
VRELAVTAVGRDRPGIVAGLTGPLVDLGGNVQDCRASILAGSFAIALAMAVPDAVGPEQARAALEPVAREMGLVVWVGDADDPREGSAGERCVVSVYGEDRPGIVHAVSAAMAGGGVNILDLSSRAVGDPCIYTLAVEAELPPGMTAAGLRALLLPVTRALGLELSVASEADEVL